MVEHLRSGGQPGFLDTKDFPDYLSQRMWKSAVNQVTTGLRSWQAGMEARIRPVITTYAAENNLSDEQRRELYIVNLRHDWFTEPETQDPLGDARRFLREQVTVIARRDHPFPHFSAVNTMLMDGPIAQLEAPTHSRDQRFAWWLRVSTPSGPVRLPLQASPYMGSQPGEVRQFCQITVTPPERRTRPEVPEITVGLVKKSPAAELRDEGCELGLDWGLANLFTTSEGLRYGQRLYRWLRERDVELTVLSVNLQRQGIALRSSKRYRQLNHRIREYVRNEIGRILNLITSRGEVSHLTVEDLDFRGSGLSRQLTRIVQRAGRAVLKARLDALDADHGITVTEVNPAHTSRECVGCGFTDKSNRTRQAVFACRFCGKRLHADVSGARCVKGRRSTSIASPHIRRSTILTHLDQQFHTRWGVSADRIRERQKRPHSRATPNSPEVDVNLRSG